MAELVGEIFSRIGLVEVQRDVVRNIVSIRDSQDLFDDLTSDPRDRALAQSLESDFKPPPYTNTIPIIRRPFEEAEWFGAIDWPFRNWQSSRFSIGTHGVWYGSGDEETTVYESAYHWYNGLLSDAGFERHTVIGERKLYNVRCSAALLDFRPLSADFSDVLHPTDYSAAQSLGSRIHRDGHPGIVVPSVRHPGGGENYAVFNAAVLSDPRARCYMTYRLEDGRIMIEKVPGTVFLSIPARSLAGL